MNVLSCDRLPRSLQTLLYKRFRSEERGERERKTRKNRGAIKSFIFGAAKVATMINRKRPSPAPAFVLTVIPARRHAGRAPPKAPCFLLRRRRTATAVVNINKAGPTILFSPPPATASDEPHAVRRSRC